MLNKNPYPKSNYPPLPKKSGKTTGSSSYSSGSSSYSGAGNCGGKDKESLRELQLICSLFPKGSKICEAAEKKIKEKDIH